jgi:outer membrane scaffolding protein for murein synthesis (MipA/OmpV family)
MQQVLKLFFIFTLFCSQALALEEENQAENLPLWEYGAGLGGIYFEKYPASDETKSWALPFPTFQYRGEIFRADDRDGTRAYLLRSQNWNLEFGGGGLPSARSSEIKAREGMDDIPWGLQMGPQLVTRLHPRVQFKIGIYQAIITPDVKFFKTSGLQTEAKLIYIIDDYLDEYFKEGISKGRFTLTVDGGSKDFLSTYFEVPVKDATAERPAYDAREGLLSYEFSYFQSIKIKKWGFYGGGSRVQYDISANRTSPLHKSDVNYRAFVGITYVLGESERRMKPEAESEGALQKIQRRLQKFE